MMMKIIERAVECQASDIHITFGSRPFFRVYDALQEQKEFETCTDDVISGYVRELTSKEKYEELVQMKQLDFAMDTPWARCRVNIFMQKGHLDVAIRLIDYRIRSIDELELSGVLKELASLRSGLILVTGVTGSGKSTTLSAMIDYINSRFRKNIITLEDPVEYIHRPVKSIIRQREVGKDVLSFADGLRAALREDPDVLLVGEMRDLETIASVITLAETGHLVLATLHTRNAPETIDRIIDVFPSSQQQQIRIQLSHVLEGIVSQMLIPRKTGGRTACLEIMRTTLPIRNIIRSKDQISKIRDEIYFNKSKLGTQTVTQALADLYLKGVISAETGMKYADNEELFSKILKNGDGGEQF